MRITYRHAFGVLVIGLTIGAAHLGAQATDQELSGEQAQQQVRSESGSLTWVNLDENTFAITTADGHELQFHLTEQTKVDGGQEGVAGLATERGTPVRVEYVAEARMAMATSIQILSQEEANQPQPAR